MMRYRGTVDSREYEFFTKVLAMIPGAKIESSEEKMDTYFDENYDEEVLTVEYNICIVAEEEPMELWRLMKAYGLKRD